jgi:hypothetical protein
METWSHGDIDTGNMEKYININGDMETLRHGDMETWPWRHEDKETWRHGDIET